VVDVRYMRVRASHVEDGASGRQVLMDTQAMAMLTTARWDDDGQ